MISTAAAAQRSQVTISLPLADGNWASSVGERKKAEGERKVEGRMQNEEIRIRRRRLLFSAFFILPSSLACRWRFAVKRSEHLLGGGVVAARAGLLDGEQGGLEFRFGKSNRMFYRR